MRFFPVPLVIVLFFLASDHSTPTMDYSGWPEYLGGPDRNHYSSLTQINKENVQKLRIAWQYSMPDSGQMQVNPIMIDGILYAVSPYLQAIALDAASGREIWRFGEESYRHWATTGRGVAYWSNGADARIFHTIGSRLYALHAKTGKPVAGFGTNGFIDLHEGLGAQAGDKFVGCSTPGTVFENLIIMPLRLSEGADAAPGYIQAFDVRSGNLVWTFHTIPHPGEYGYETWPPDAWKNTNIGGANNWAGSSIDRDRGILYVPTGSASPDFYGGFRKGQNLFANCLLALDARTGKRLWHYQFVHHDLWDRDLPAPPNLIRVKKHSKWVDAVAQITKSGYVFVFNRETGKPLFPIKEVKTLPSSLEGEAPWPTQPVPVKPAPFARQELKDTDISPYAENREELLKILKATRKRRFEPPSKEGTLYFPGFDGGGEWGGAAADPQAGILYVNSTEMAWIQHMTEVPRPQDLAHMSPGERVYMQACASCHKTDLSGIPSSGFPGLKDISKRRSRDFVSNIIQKGKSMMPGFSYLSKEERAAVVAFLFSDEKAVIQPVSDGAIPYVPYEHTGYNKFLDSKGHPAITPPWGTLSAIDLNTGDFRWQITLGDTREFREKGYPQTGAENYGGPLVTQSGLLFIAATKDGMFRAFDKTTGKLLWEVELPAAAFATPCTYQINGKQYVVVVCGGTKLGVKKGNQVVAFALE
ncbi:MAG: PQQ-binding-like beta-propeller repeat protein [Saprospiraceae bacterium]|nr:PQQ-binding-like beta-propeller repeat protein [Saprospiraceae bacterium]